MTTYPREVLKCVPDGTGQVCHSVSQWEWSDTLGVVMGAIFVVFVLIAVWKYGR